MNRIIVLCLLLCAVACGEKEAFIKNVSSGAALGTTYNLVYLTADEPLDLQGQIDSVFQAVNRSLSTYLPDSDISKINRGDSTVVVDAMFREVFSMAKDVHRATKGYFDPTVGLLVNAWGFGPGERMKMDSAQVLALKSRVGFDMVSLTPEGLVKMEKPGMYLDFNAIAKGYAIDRLAKLMDSHYIDDYLLEVGGELVAKGENRIRHKLWVVGIDDPQMETTRQLKTTIRLKDKGLASSGNYRHFRVDEKTGAKYVHTIDPITGFTKNARTLGATIVANNCATADAYATAFMAMDLDEALILLTEDHELEAYLIYIDQNGEVVEFMTPGFKEMVVGP
ncbi:FAD:protein FMN transferase [Pseudozobellia thermophila]|uniref:FAD:protein FMN transferase n=1 Tax=Pseudozobellia thermophila TaxID=192903 RepID=A0A1M6JTH2_9FLAO|nr:FAD:protein FMN transferase [Pseudozobellia thermophila]SHJ49932.1 thiamine biosynthesis lipoprotein [Pseudozobellia thermophila]